MTPNCRRLSTAMLTGLICCSFLDAGRGQIVQWTRQLGTSSIDGATGVSADGLGSVYISGRTQGSLGGPYAGVNHDAFVSKYDAAGNFQWTRQLGTAFDDQALDASADGLGSVYISGQTIGDLGGPNAGFFNDAFVSKYDAAGNFQWTRQFGSSSDDSSQGVSADGVGNIYVSGVTSGALGGPNAGGNDAFVRKYDAAGNAQWTRQFGTSGTEVSSDLSADGLGNVYVSGHTSGNLGGMNAGSFDAVLLKYNAAGTLQWTRQLGTSALDVGLDVSADGLGNVYLSGITRGSLASPHAGADDAFVSKYDASGNLLWTRQWGTSTLDQAIGVSADGLGNVYVSGATDGSLGSPNAGSYDAYVTMYDAAGILQWTHQFGTSSHNDSLGVSADGLGKVYLAGATENSLGGPSAGSYDAYVMKLRPIPEPTGVVLMLAAALGCLGLRRGARIHQLRCGCRR